MADRLSIPQRLLLHTLLEATAPVSILTVMRTIGVKPKSASHLISRTRLKIEPTGARIICHGNCDARRYELVAADRAAVLVMAGPKVVRPTFMGFADRHGEILRLIVEAAGRPMSLREISVGVYDCSHAFRRDRVASMIETIRIELAARGSEQTILRRGSLYLWGPATDDAEDAPPRADGITLPSVGGAYRYAAGRLMLDGQVVGRAA